LPTYQKKRFSSVQRAVRKSPEYKLTVSETVRLGTKKDSNGGLEGYELKKWHHDINKPLITVIHAPGKKVPHFLDGVLTTKKNVPAPNTY
jgi:hypothetical protein